MDYLKGRALASVPALWVTVRMMAARDSMWSEPELQQALMPVAASPRETGAAADPEGARGALAASLEVGLDLGILRREGNRIASRRWHVATDVAEQLWTGALTTPSQFRCLVLFRLGAAAVAATPPADAPSDVALAATWLLQQDVRRSWAAAWGEGPEAAFRGAGMQGPVANTEQYRALRRWLRSLGLVVLTRPETDSKARMMLDPTWAVQAALPVMPRGAPARVWLSELRRHLPVLGATELLARLPEGSLPPAEGASDVPGPLALALAKLNRMGSLRLRPSDDAADSVTLPLPFSLRVGNIEVAT